MTVFSFILFSYVVVALTTLLADYSDRGRLSWTLQTYFLWPVLVVTIIFCTREPIWLKKILKNRREK